MKNLKSLSDLFEKYIFRIPEYQRGYAWQEEHYSDFWEDLLKANLHDHYTGMISLERIDINNDRRGWDFDDNWALKNEQEEKEVYYVVDGQQRLTTSVILIFCFLKFFKEKGISKIGNNDLLEVERKYIKVTKEYRSPVYIFSYVKEDSSREFFEDKIFEGRKITKELDQTYYTNNLEGAKEFFTKKIKLVYETSNNGIEELEFIFKKLIERLKFNMFYVNSDFDVYVAFETMNNRGKKLSTLELLKNRLLYIISVLSEDEAHRNYLRKHIIDAWVEIYKQIGKNKDNKLSDEDFLRSHWNIYYPYSRSRGVNYISDLLDKRFTLNRFVEEKKKRKPSAEEFFESSNIEELEKRWRWDKIIIKYVESLMQISRYFYFAQTPGDKTANINITDIEINLLKRINRLGFVSFLPMIMALLSNKDDINEIDRITILEHIEKLIFIRYRCAGALSTYKMNTFYTEARRLYQTKNPSECIKVLKTELNEAKVGFGKRFENKIKDLIRKGYGFYGWNELRYFLFEYEQGLMESGRNSSLVEAGYFYNRDKRKDMVSIEHILPQTPNEAYGYWLNALKDYNEEEQMILTNSLGNLLPLSQSINSSLQNNSFEEKKVGTNERRGYKDGTLSEREVVDKWDKWTPNAILERGLKMLDFFEKHWDVKLYEGNKFEDSYKQNRKDALTKFLELEFVNKQDREIKQELVVIPAEAVKFSDGKGSILQLSQISNNYYVNLPYYKIMKQLKEKGIENVLPIYTWSGYVDLHKIFDDDSTEIFATVRFDRGANHLEVNIPNSNENNQAQYLVKNGEDVSDIVQNLIISYNSILTGTDVTFEKIVKTIEKMLTEAIDKGKTEIEISAWDVQSRLIIKRSAPRIWSALDYVKTEKDTIVEKPPRVTLAYKIKFDLISRMKKRRDK